MIEILTIPLIRLFFAILVFLALVGVLGLVLVYMERKVVGFIQLRPGPYEVGPRGILQPLADALKLIGKQLVFPEGADVFLFWVAPIISVMPIILCFLPIPFGFDLRAMNINLGLLLILAFSGFNVLALCLAGWGSNNKYALLGAARAVSQSIAYEIPLLLSVLSITLQVGSFDLAVIASEQSSIISWNVWIQPLAFIIFFISITAETNRAPFDLPEAESELAAGHHIEYSGMGFGLFMIAEYMYMVVMCSVASVLFLGGWNGPFFPDWLWMFIKIFMLMLVLMFFRWTFPRVRFDQLLNICWKWLIPLGLVNFIITALVMKICGG